LEKTENTNPENEEENLQVPGWLFVLFIAGFVLVLVGVIIVVLATSFADVGGPATSSGVVIFIGPFPIVFGAGPGATWLVLIGGVLSAISIIIFMISRRKIWRTG
jgi:uncharacterized membrane protein